MQQHTTCIEEINALRADCLKFIDKNNSLQAQLDVANLALAGARDYVLQFAESILHGDESHKQWLIAEAKAFIEKQELPTPAKAPDLTRIAAVVEYAHSLYMNKSDDCTYDSLLQAVEALTPEDHAWVERVGGG
jgi:hypothetical protein